MKVALKLIGYSFSAFWKLIAFWWKVFIRFLKANIRAIIYISLGTIFFFLGVIGAIFPVLPAIPFFVLSLVFFLRCSRRLTSLIMNSKIGDFMRSEISMKMKISVIISFWLSIALPSLLITSDPYVIGISVGFCVVSTVYIIRLKRFADMLGEVGYYDSSRKSENLKKGK